MSFDLKKLVRGGAADSEIADAIRALVAQKPAAHDFIIENKIHGHSATMMSKIGG
jgi:molybdenum cofactor biosynthesis enzyme MoaA